MQRTISVASAIFLMAGIYATSFYNYLLFHSVAEMFSVVIACGIFMVAWNTRGFASRQYLLFLGIAYLFVGFLDFVHALSYDGMNVIPGYGPNAPTQLWIAARYMESLTLLAAPLMLTRRIRPAYYFLFYATASALAILAIFVWRVFPDCFVPGAGLTRFKIVSEYAICAILAAAGAFLLYRREHFEKDFLAWALSSIATTMLSELVFTAYASVYGFANLLGHFLKILSFYLIYKAVIETGLARPYDLLFRDLHRQRERFRVTLKSIGDAVIATDAGGDVTFLNPAAESLTGWRSEEAAGRAVSDVFRIVDERTGEPVENPLSRVLHERRAVPPSRHAVLIARDGHAVPVDKRAAPILDGEEKVAGAVLVFQDVTQKRRAEETLRESELRFRLALRNSPVSVTAQDRDLRYIWAYNQGADFPENFVGLRDEDIFPPGEASHLAALKKRVLAENVELREQMWFDRPGGRVFRDITWEPICDEASRVAGVASASVDLTSIKLAEEALKISLAEKDVLLKEIHHRVKNNLQMVSSLLNLQAQQAMDASVGEIFLEVIQRIHSMAMVHETLYRSPDLAHVEFAGYVETLLEHLCRAQGPKGSGIRIDTDLEPVRLTVNEAVPCGMILNELFSNAMKHAFRGRSGGTVSVSLREDEEGKVFLCVSDDGAGMPPGTDWETFNSLGLRLVRMLTRQLRAEVEFRSGEGTRFDIRFRKRKDAWD